MVDYVEPGNRCVLELYWQSHSETEIECNDHNIHSRMFDGITREGVTGIKVLGSGDLSYKILFLARIFI
nr:12185_t:CDS:2 [Entrophospora candida]